MTSTELTWVGSIRHYQNLDRICPSRRRLIASCGDCTTEFEEGPHRPDTLCEHPPTPPLWDNGLTGALIIGNTFASISWGEVLVYRLEDFTQPIQRLDIWATEHP